MAHLWSLAIEEQFYLLFPLMFAGIMRIVGRRRRLPIATAGAAWTVLAAASFAAAWVLAGGGDHSGLVYYATFTRAGALIVGGAAAHAVGLAVGEPGELLRRAEGDGRGDPRCLSPGRDHRGDDPGRHLRREEGMTSGDAAHGIDQLLGLGVLEQEAARARP